MKPAVAPAKGGRRGGPAPAKPAKALPAGKPVAAKKAPAPAAAKTKTAPRAEIRRADTAIRPAAVKAHPPARLVTGPAPAMLKHRGEPAAQSKTRKEKFTARELAQFRAVLLAMRAKLATQVATMRQNALVRSDEVNPEEDGTDAFDRIFTLERAGGMQSTIQQINNALRAIDEQKYGICDACGCLIGHERLRARPFAKNCVTCQLEIDRQNSNRPNRPRRLVP